MTATAPPLTEAQFQQQIVELARIYGWEDFHVRAGRTRDSWRVPGSGTMAKGWPDLVLVHPVKRLLMFVEVKADKGKTTPAQERVLDVLRTLAGEFQPMYGDPERLLIEVRVWRPEDWPFIEKELTT